MLRKKNKPEQFLKCFEGWCRYYGAPHASVYDLREDRCLFRHTLQWPAWAAAHMEPWKAGITKHNPLGADFVTARQGWRGKKVMASLQVIRHELDGFQFMEVDFDAINPSQGLAPLIGHGLEYCWYRLPLLWGGHKRKTNPYRVAKALRRRGVIVGVA